MLITILNTTINMARVSKCLVVPATPDSVDLVVEVYFGDCTTAVFTGASATALINYLESNSIRLV